MKKEPSKNESSKKIRPKARPAGEMTDKEKIQRAVRILKKRIGRKIHRYRVKRIKQGRKHRLLRKKLTFREYVEYRIYEFLNGEWKQFVILLLTLLIAVLLLTGIVRGVSGMLSHPKKPQKVVETETETETETEKIYPEKDITIGSTGCMLLHSPFITSYPDEQGNYDFSSIYKFITPYYKAADFMTCEFEGALGGEELGYSGYPTFISPDIIIQNIKDSGVDLQFLASNHIYDGGSSGFHRTMDVYEDLNIQYSGIRKTIDDKPYYVAKIKGIKVGFINYVYETEGQGTWLNGIPMNEEDGDLINSFDYNDLESFYKEMQKNIQSMKNEGVQFVVAQLHWGTEYMLEESSQQDEIAQKLCDLGVNAIIGGHPHCEQPIDVVTSKDGTNNMFVIYSEGNALSNQRTYLMDEMPTGHTEDGVVVTLTLHQDTRGDVSIKDIELLPTWVYRYPDDQGLSKYYIFPLDDVDNIEKNTGVTGIKDEAKASYERTMEELGPGLEKAKDVFRQKETEPDTEAGSEETTEESSSEV